MSTNIFRAFRLTTRAITAAFEKGQAVTLPQYLILESLAEKGGQSQTQLSEVTGIDRTTISSILKRLEESNFVKLERSSEDLRTNVLHLTVEGRREQRKLARRAEKLSAKLCDSEAASAKLVADLTAIAKRAGS